MRLLQLGARLAPKGQSRGKGREGEGEGKDLPWPGPGPYWAAMEAVSHASGLVDRLRSNLGGGDGVLGESVERLPACLSTG